MKPFEVGVDIEDVNRLYGRKKHINSLRDKAEGKENAGIIGPRRFGKTCILKVMETIIRNEYSDLFPIYFNAKGEGISKDSVQFYRKLAATAAAEMCQSGLIKKGRFRLREVGLKLNISNDRIANEEQIREFSDERQQKLIFYLSNYLWREAGITTLLLLDDIDYVLLSGLRQASDFSVLRDKVSNKDPYIKYWVAGPSSFSSICSKVGSGELNNGIQNVYLEPISINESKRLWESECAIIQDLELREYVLDKFEFAYEKSGGVPFYLKLIGLFFLDKENYGKYPSYMVLRDYIKEMVDNKLFLDSERNAMHYLASHLLTADEDEPDGVNLLITKGLAKTEKKSIVLTIGFLKDYISACQKETVPVGKKLDEIVTEIIKLRSNINKEWDSYSLWKTERTDGKSYPPFCPSIDDPIQFDILRKTCKDEADYKAFSSALYQLYYEGSHSGNNLPLGFAPRRRSWDSNCADFPQFVMINRHMFEHRDYKPNESINLTDRDLLNAINEGKHPRGAEDYSRMQYNLLQRCLEELGEMLDALENSH